MQLEKFSSMTMSNPFKDWTPDMAKQHNERVSKRKPILPPNDWRKPPRMIMASPLAIKQIAPKKKPLLNATEKLFKAELERRGYKIILCQAITFRLGDRMTYRPDFVTVESLYNLRIDEGQIRMTCWETKGPHRFRQAGINKLKAAAALYPWIQFRLIERNKGQWTEKEIGQ